MNKLELMRQRVEADLMRIDILNVFGLSVTDNNLKLIREEFQNQDDCLDKLFSLDTVCGIVGSEELVNDNIEKRARSIAKKNSIIKNNVKNLKRRKETKYD